MGIILVNISHKQKGLTSAQHSVLNVMSVLADDKYECAPSIHELCESTSLNRKTVQALLVELTKKNLLIKTGEMRGKTKAVPVYKLNISEPENGNSKQSQIIDKERDITLKVLTDLLKKMSK